MKIICLIPSKGEKAANWLEQLPEIKLLGDLRCVSIPWESTATGNEQDWLNAAKAIYTHWNQADGFLIWAPEKSALATSGIVKLALKKIGKPVITFSAPFPETLKDNAFEKLGLKAAVIRAVYLAISEMAEVLVLQEEKVYRPPQCLWEEQKKKSIIVSSQSPLATIDYELNIHQEYAKRNDQLPHALIPDGLSQEITFQQWITGLPLPEVKKDKLNIIEVQNYQLETKEFQEAREENHDVLWYHRGRLSEKEEKNASVISHPQAWWMILTARYELAHAKKEKDFTKKIRALINS